MKSFKNGIKFIGLLVIGVVAGIFVAGIVIGAKKHTKGDKSEAIKVALEKNCDCEKVDRFIYAIGLQYSKNDGLSNEKAEYELTNCAYKNLYDEAERINNVLAQEVADYKDLDFLKLEFVGNDKNETVIIKNGVVQ